MLPLLPTASLQEIGTTSARDEKEGSREKSRMGIDEGASPRKPLPTAAEVNGGDWTPYAPPFTPQLRALLESQIKHPPPHLTRPVARRLQPRLELLNSWKRPMPKRRVANATKKWYAETLDKVHPPLPTQEWYRLRDLARGVKSEPIPIRRRGAPAPAPDALELVVTQGQPSTQKAFEHRHGHAMTPRFMRRLWAQVFAQCPLMEWDAPKERWKVVWGEHELHGLQRRRNNDSVIGDKG